MQNPQRRELEGRAAFVTGAASGVGRAIALRLAAAGARVAAADRDVPGAGDVTRAIEAQEGEGRAVAVGMDVTCEDDVRRAFESAVRACGRLCIVVSNAGVAHAGPVEDLTVSDWRRSLDVNAGGHFLVARAALRVMKDQGLGGSLVFTGTKNVPAPGRGFIAYSAAKAAETHFARAAAVEGGPHGIRVNVVHPDGIFEGSRLWSEEIRRERARAHGVPPEALENFYRRRNLLQTRVFAEDVAEAVLFLVSDRASKITGAALGVDGGVSAAFPR